MLARASDALDKYGFAFMVANRVTGVVTIGALYVGIKYGVDVSTILDKYGLDATGACVRMSVWPLVRHGVHGWEPCCRCLHASPCSLFSVAGCCVHCTAGQTVGTLAGAVCGASVLWPLSVAALPLTVPRIAKLVGSRPR